MPIRTPEPPTTLRAISAGLALCVGGIIATRTRIEGADPVELGMKARVVAVADNARVEVGLPVAPHVQERRPLGAHNHLWALPV
jgi:hypothetical protein